MSVSMATRTRLQMIQLSYDRETDTISQRLRPDPTVERTEDAGEGRSIDYVGDDPVGVTFRAAHKGICTDGLPEELVALSAAAATFAAVARLLPSREAPAEPGSHEGEQEETDYLLRSRVNAARLFAAYDRALRGEGEPVDLEQYRLPPGPFSLRSIERISGRWCRRGRPRGPPRLN